MHTYIDHLSIDRIEVLPECALAIVDHHMPAQFRGHYIRAGSGTHIFWLLDAETGDFLVEQIN